MESAGVDAGENMLADPGAAPACPKAASVIPMQSQAEALQNNFPGPRLKLKTLFSQLASDVFVVWLHDVCCQDSGLPQGQLYDFFGDGMIAAHAKFVKSFVGPIFPSPAAISCPAPVSDDTGCVGEGMSGALPGLSICFASGNQQALQGHGFTSC